MSIVLTSENPLKRQAVESFFKDKVYNIITINCNACGLPPQPINCGMECAAMRIKFAKSASTINPENIIISIENDLKNANNIFYDTANVIIEIAGIKFRGKSEPIKCLSSELINDQKLIQYSNKIWGYNKTGGEILHEKLGVSKNNWMKFTQNKCRTIQIGEALRVAYNSILECIESYNDLKSKEKIYPNFPKEGVDFKYFYSFFGTNGMNNLSKIIKNIYGYENFDAILPLESRGLILATIIADHNKTTMIPIQKAGKVPGEFITMTYEKRYGVDQVQMSVDIFRNVLKTNREFYKFMIVDDLIATGGSIEAVLRILEKLSDQFSFAYKITIMALNDIPPLRGLARQKIGNDYCVLFNKLDEIKAILKSNF